MSEPIKSMPPSDAYKENWERIYLHGTGSNPSGKPIKGGLPPVWEIPAKGPQKEDL